MIDSKNGKVKFNGTRSEISADYGVIYKSMLKFFTPSEIKEIQQDVIDYEINKLKNMKGV